MEKPLVAIVGRPNAGKSTFFNRMAGEPLAIVEDEPGTTRDRLYIDTDWAGYEFTLIDTGGLEPELENDITRRIRVQAEQAIEEADVVIFLVDVREGVTPGDQAIAEVLRRTKKPVVLGANKADNVKRRLEAVEFYELGLGEPITMSGIQGVGTGDVLDEVVRHLPKYEEAPEESALPKIAIAGRPNVGKSSLLNTILGEDRVIVSEIPGTTRDAIDTLVTHKGQEIVLIDTAGIRRRGKVDVGVEKYSVLRALRAINRADVVLLLIDASEGLVAQDTHVAGYIHEAAKGVVIVVNKWDIVKTARARARDAEREGVPGPIPGEKMALADTLVMSQETYREDILQRLKFLPYASVLFASAKTGFHVPQILDAALKIATERQKRIPTAQLNKVVEEAVQRHKPPLAKGKQPKIYYATQGAVNPPTFIFFANDASLLHFSYQRYLENTLRESFGFEGTAVRIFFRSRPKNEKS